MHKCTCCRERWRSAGWRVGVYNVVVAFPHGRRVASVQVLVAWACSCSTNSSMRNGHAPDGS